MSYEFKAVRRVEFSDTDMAGIMHFSNFFRFMETAEHGFFRSLGLSIINDPAHPGVGWPRVRAECDYTAPLHFQDEVEIHLLVAEKKSKSIRYVFKFRKLNDPPVEAARGSVTVVCVTHSPGVKMKACAIPAVIAGKIQTAPPELLQ
jgi:YbgC/YbaW family acyl-CoA thioester hydrolase